MKMKLFIPFIILFALVGLLWRGLFYVKKNEIPSALIGQTLPDFQLPNILEQRKLFTPKDLVGRASLLNIWASWCYACSVEHPMLMRIKKIYHVPIYGIIYKDNVRDVKSVLRLHGNPFTVIGNDSTGDVAIDLGVYGTPETYVINPQGKIIYRHIGVIDQQTWDNVLYPMIKQFEPKLS